MRNTKFNLTVFILLLLFAGVKAQNDKNWSLSGYAKDMQTVWFQEADQNWTTDNLIHNRLNFKWYTTKSLTTVVEMRNRFMWGELVETTSALAKTSQYFQGIGGFDIPGLEGANKASDLLISEYGYFDLSGVIAEDTSYVLHTAIDRAYLDFIKGKWQVTAGRQRVNWGVGLVWNPNDVFNTFSYFDFDYEERPGTDAVRVQYYPDYTSSAELVYELGETIDESAFAGMYRFNKWTYDFQFLGGMVRKDYVAGLGWSGQIEGAGFRGELTYFHPKDDFRDTTGITVATIGGDYTFRDGLYLHAAFLYNSNGTTGKATRSSFILNEQISAKNLTPARYSIFGQVAYPVTPLIRADLSGIYNPSDRSAFVGPSVTISLMNNLDLLLNTQLFYGREGTEYGDVGKLFFLRMKYSF